MLRFLPYVAITVAVGMAAPDGFPVVRCGLILALTGLLFLCADRVLK